MDGDPDLLRRYVEEHSEPAFTELVRRHLNLVYFAALRQMGGDAHRAQDVTQAVFTDLARKARMLTNRPTLTGWLHTSTRFAAAGIRRAEANRRKYEQEAEIMGYTYSESQTVADWERLRPMIDDAVHELNERDREAVLLRFFEGRAFGEIGRVLNLSEDGARMRVERALDKLHRLLAKRGVTSTSAAVAAALASQATATAPAGLAASISGSALSGAAVATTAGSLATAIYFMSASKIAIPVAVAGALATGGAIYQASQAHAAAAELTQARAGRAVMITRLVALEKSIAITEKEQADRRAALERAQLAKASEEAAAARQAAADEEKAKQQKALQQFLANDPELRRLRAEADREAFRSGNHGLFLKSIGMTAEQIDQAAQIRVENKALQFAQIGAGIDLQTSDRAESYYLPKFRAMFGEAAAERFASYLSRWLETQVVNDLSASQFYKDQPFDAQQAERLIDIFAKAKTGRVSGFGRYGAFDWERVLHEAKPVLSPAQFDSLRAFAGQGQNAALLASIAKQSTATARK